MLGNIYSYLSLLFLVKSSKTSKFALKYKSSFIPLKLIKEFNVDELLTIGESILLTFKYASFVTLSKFTSSPLSSNKEFF